MPDTLADSALGRPTPIAPPAPAGDRLTDRAINAFAAFITETRPDWQSPGVVAALRADRDAYDPWQLAVAMIRRASNVANVTPRLQAFDFAGEVGCRRHPGGSVRTDGTCGTCFAERFAVRDDAPQEPKTDRGHPLRDAVARLG